MKKLLLSVLLFLLLCSIGLAKTYKLEFIWNKNTETDLAGYEFFRGDPNFNNYYIILENIPADVNTCIIDSNIIIGDSAYFAMKAFNDKGNRSDFSNILSYFAKNATPLACPQNVEIKKNNSIDLVLSAEDSDGDSLVYSIFSNPLHGNLSGEPPDIKYTPNHDFAGNDSFTFMAGDGILYSKPAVVNITIEDVAPSAPKGVKLLNCLPVI